MGSSRWKFRVRIFMDTLFDTLPHGVKTPRRLPPSENGEWWEIGDESRGGIPYYYHTKTGETVWEKPDGFVIPLTVLQVCPITLSLCQTDLERPNRTPHSAVVSQSRSLRQVIRPHLLVQPGRSRAPRLTIRVHIRKRVVGPLTLLAVYSPQPVAQLPPRRRARTPLRPCVAT
jgi:hypothetical protein